jgi:ABC-2 type transport system ATP-binding protein
MDLLFGSGVTALVGVNGAGKSTLLSVLSGALRPRHGRVTLDGTSLYTRARRSLLPRIALMPQSFRYPRNFTVREVVEYLAWMRGLPRGDIAAATSAALEQVDMAHRADVKMQTLSGGMVRRVALAQAIVARPDVLLLDEPTTGLDPEQRARLRATIGNLDPQAITVMSSHVMEDVERVADTVVVLDAGELLFHDSLSQLKAMSPLGSTENAAESAFLHLVGQHRVAS